MSKRPPDSGPSAYFSRPNCRFLLVLLESDISRRCVLIFPSLAEATASLTTGVISPIVASQASNSSLNVAHAL